MIKKSEKHGILKADGRPLSEDLKRTGHKPPVTRREFLATGAIGFSGMLMMPMLLEGLLLSRKAFAAGCGDEAAGGLIPFLTFDLAGGAGLAGNFLVGGQGGPKDLLPSYSKLGWNPKLTGALDESYGLPMAALNVSRMLVGLNQTASAEARAGLRFGSFLHNAQDDTSSNPLSILTTVSKAGARGLFLSNGLGTDNNPQDSGGNSRSLKPDPVYRPTQVQSVADMTASVSFGPGLSKTPQKMLESMGRMGVRLAEAQTRKYMGNPDGDLLRQLSDCSLQKTLSFTQGATGVDPRLEAAFQAVYGLNANTNPKSRPAILATIVMNVLKGNSGPGCITIGGCDYHVGDQETGDAKDLEIGQEIGRAVESAYRLGKPLFLHIISDGSVGAKADTRVWINDSGVQSMTVIGYFDPKLARKQVRQQVGYFTSGQGAATDTVIQGDVSLASYAALANYLQLNGRLDYFNQNYGEVFGTKVEDVMIFE
jgi:hypothetical protein